MRLANWVAVVVVCASVVSAAALTVDAPNGFRIRMNASLQPGGRELLSGVTEGREGRLHRFVLDGENRRYFAYDLVLTAVGADGLGVRMEKLTLPAEEIAKLPFIGQGWSAAGLPKLPDALEVKNGHRLTIELIDGGPAGQRAVDDLLFTR